MKKKKIKITFPDETQLIAEATEDPNYPCINIYQRDNEGEIDAIAFAEYNPDSEFGRKLMVFTLTVISRDILMKMHLQTKYRYCIAVLLRH